MKGKRNLKGVRQRCLLSPILFNIYLQYLTKNCFLNKGGVTRGSIKCIKFVDDMAFLAEYERMLKNMLMELNDRCEDYGMKINITKTKSMVIGRKPKEIDKGFKDEPVEQVDRFKYLECNISSYMNCRQEVKQRIAMEKEAFNRKRCIFCGPCKKNYGGD